MDTEGRSYLSVRPPFPRLIDLLCLTKAEHASANGAMRLPPRVHPTRSRVCLSDSRCVGVYGTET